jgi:putative chitinase
MSTLITAEQLSQCMPKCREPEIWAPILDERLFEAGIVEPKQIAAFIAQTGHESLNFNVLEENLNYSEDGLRRIFGKYFRSVSPALYARNPKKIASRVYANRMGNGDEGSEDGWRFRGRGILQVTGRFNYEKCSSYIYGDKNVLLDDPDLLTEKEPAMLSAIWYWDANRLKHVVDFTELTRRINGGTHGLDDRQARYNRALRFLVINSR